MGDRLGQRWARRALTVPGFLIALAVVSVLLPALLVLAGLVDLRRGFKNTSTLRLTVFLWCFLATEAVGLSLLGLTFLVTLGRPSSREALTFWVQGRYVALHWWFTSRVFGLQASIEAPELAAGGPLIVLVRHASLVDVLVPAVFVANPHRLRLRYALKRELLWEPCLDVAGHWIPNHFVARGGSDTAADVAGVRRLKEGLGPDGGVLLFPEGTRFSAGRRARELARLAPGSPEHATAQRLRHLLPLRPGGVLALLDAAPSCDVLFVGHRGLEGLTDLSAIWRGGLTGRTLKLKFWREPAANVPKDPVDRLGWLTERWQRVDDWLEAEER